MTIKKNSKSKFQNKIYKTKKNSSTTKITNKTKNKTNLNYLYIFLPTKKKKKISTTKQQSQRFKLPHIGNSKTTPLTQNSDSVSVRERERERDHVALLRFGV